MDAIIGNNAVVAAITNPTGHELAHLGVLTVASFRAAVTDGTPFVQALDAIKPSLEILQKQYDLCAAVPEDALGALLSIARAAKTDIPSTLDDMNDIVRRLDRSGRLGSLRRYARRD